MKYLQKYLYWLLCTLALITSGIILILLNTQKDTPWGYPFFMCKTVMPRVFLNSDRYDWISKSSRFYRALLKITQFNGILYVLKNVGNSVGSDKCQKQKPDYKYLKVRIYR